MGLIKAATRRGGRRYGRPVEGILLLRSHPSDVLVVKGSEKGYRPFQATPRAMTTSSPTAL